MPEIYLPKKIIFKKNVLNEIRTESCSHALLISDSEALQNYGTIENLRLRISKSVPDVTVIINPDVQSLYSGAAEAFFSREAELIVAIGSASAIDCGMILSYESNAEFTAIPCCCASALTDFESGGYYTYRHSPDTLILDPALIEKMPSGTIAYDGIASLAYAIDTLNFTDNTITRSLALHGAIGILKNIVPAYRGDIPALEKLMYSMYFSVASHRNAKGVENSLLSRTCKFFSLHGYSKASVCAVILPDIIEAEGEKLQDILSELAVTSGVSRTTDSKAFSSIMMTEKIRHISASLDIPRAISGFGLKPLEFHKSKQNSDIPESILDQCYYGGFKFMKL